MEVHFEKDNRREHDERMSEEIKEGLRRIINGNEGHEKYEIHWKLKDISSQDQKFYTDHLKILPIKSEEFEEYDKGILKPEFNAYNVHEVKEKTLFLKNIFTEKEGPKNHFFKIAFPTYHIG